MTRIVITLGVLLLGASAADAQIPVGTRVGGPVEVGGYDSAGKRDPFVSLVVSRRPTPTAATTGVGRPASGLATFAVADVLVTGIIRAGDKMLAILQGADRQSFTARVGDRLMDATVKTIDPQGVVFLEKADASAGVKPQEVRKLLRRTEEVNR
jgi:Tfp pilus assembly protein PilP